MAEIKRYLVAEYLKKRSSGGGFLGIGEYNVRWFQFLQNGKYLVYYHKFPQNKNIRPKGVFNTSQITNVQPEKDTILNVTFLNGKKVLTLKCQKQKNRNMWVNCLRRISAYYKQKHAEEVRQLQNEMDNNNTKFTYKMDQQHVDKKQKVDFDHNTQFEPGSRVPDEPIHEGSSKICQWLWTHKERSYMEWVHFSNLRLMNEYVQQYKGALQGQVLDLDLHDKNDAELSQWVPVVSQTKGLRLNFYENQQVTLPVFTQFMNEMVKNQKLHDLDVDLRQMRQVNDDWLKVLGDHLVKVQSLEQLEIWLWGCGNFTKDGLAHLIQSVEDLSLVKFKFYVDQTCADTEGMEKVVEMLKRETEDKLQIARVLGPTDYRLNC